MSCPYCETELLDYDEKTLRHVGEFFLKMTKPWNIAKGIFNVGKTIYYDFSDITQTEKYLYCKKCDVYFIRCCHCSHLNCIGSDIMVSPKKITCVNCSKDYVYATHPDPDADHGF